jgi:hypothetical protein
VTAPLEFGIGFDPHGADIIIRVRVQSKPGATEIPTLQIVTPDGQGVEILGIGHLDDAAVDAAWATFRKRATAYILSRRPRDFLKFDLFHASAIPERVVRENAGGLAATAIRMGGMTVAQIDETLHAKRREP